MGFSGGGTNILRAHKHSSAAQDGGPLDMDNDTEGSLTAGDIVYSDGNALQRLAIGAATNQLVVNGAATAPEWSAGGGGGFTMTTQFISGYTNNQTTTSSPLVDITGSSWNVPTRAGGKAYMTAFHTIEANGAGYLIGAGLYWDGADRAISKQITHSSGAGINIGVSGITDLDGGLVKGRWRTSGGTATLKNTASTEGSACNSLELS